MKLSTRFRYGTRFMIDLAMYCDKGPLAMTDVTNQERLSKKYLEQIAYRLLQANLIKSVRGPKGGYVLTRPPEKIRIIDIYKAIEGPLVLVKCLKLPDSCDLVKTCAARDIWSSLQNDLESNLTHRTLLDLINIKRKKTLKK